MKKYYNVTLCTLLFFLFNFNLYGQTGTSTTLCFDTANILDNNSTSFASTAPVMGWKPDMGGSMECVNISNTPRMGNSGSTILIEKNGVTVQKIELLSLQGKTQNQVSIFYHSHKIEINTNNLQPDVYILKLNTVNETVEEEIIIQ